MFRSIRGETNPGLDSVLEAAMNDLKSLVYDSHVSTFLRPRQRTTHFHLDGSQGTGRAVKHLNAIQVLAQHRSVASQARASNSRRQVDWGL